MRLEILQFSFILLFSSCDSTPDNKTACVGSDVNIPWEYPDSAGMNNVAWEHINSSNAATVVLVQATGSAAMVQGGYNIQHNTNGDVTITAATVANSGTYRITVGYSTVTPTFTDDVVVNVYDPPTGFSFSESPSGSQTTFTCTATSLGDSAANLYIQVNGVNQTSSVSATVSKTDTVKCFLSGSSVQCMSGVSGTVTSLCAQCQTTTSAVSSTSTSTTTPSTSTTTPSTSTTTPTTTTSISTSTTSPSIPTSTTTTQSAAISSSTSLTTSSSAVTTTKPANTTSSSNETTVIIVSSVLGGLFLIGIVITIVLMLVSQRRGHHQTRNHRQREQDQRHKVRDHHWYPSWQDHGQNNNTSYIEYPGMGTKMNPLYVPYRSAHRGEQNYYLGHLSSDHQSYPRNHQIYYGGFYNNVRPQTNMHSNQQRYYGGRGGNIMISSRLPRDENNYVAPDYELYW